MSLDWEKPPKVPSKTDVSLTDTSKAKFLQHTRFSRGGSVTATPSPGRNLESKPSLDKESTVVALGFWRRRWKHVKRWRYWYATSGIIFTAAALIILFLAIIPAIMQRIVDTTDLPVHAATIMRPTAGGVQFSLDASFKVPPGITVGLKPFTIGLFNEGGNSSNPYLKLSLPETKLKGNTTISVANQETQILDLAQFTDFIGTYVKSEEFTISESASTNAFLGALNVPIKLNKNIKMKGLNNLVGLSFPELAFVFPPLPDGSNLNGTINLPNPSVVTSALGNLTLDMRTGGITLGQARINNVILAPGNNTLPLTATLDIKTAIRNLPIILAAQSDALKSGNIEISASGNSTIYDGVHIPYYEDVLNSIILPAKIPLMQILMDSTESLSRSNPGLISGLLKTLNKTNVT